MNLYERIAALCHERGMSIAKMCRDAGISQGTMTDLKMGRKKSATSTTLIKIANALDVPADYLLSDAGEGVSFVRIPVYGEIAAGLPILAEQIIIDYESIPAQMARGGEYFALQVKGNSMEPRMFSGDVVILRKTEEFVSGSVCAVMVNGEEATLKKVIVRPNGITLIPLNPAYNPLNFSNDQIKNLPVRCFGVAVEVRGKM